MEYIGREFVSRDGYKCKIVEDLEPDSNKIPSNRRYKIQFEDGYCVDYCYPCIKKSNFKKIKNSYIGQEFTSKDGYVCKIIRDLDEDSTKLPSVRRYLVRFENGCTYDFNYNTLRDGAFRLPTVFTVIGKSYKSKSDNSTCTILRFIDGDGVKDINKSKVLVRFDDKTERILGYVSVTSGSFTRRKKGRKFRVGDVVKSADGYFCTIVFIDESCGKTKVRVKLRYEDGVELWYSYESIKKAIFQKSNGHESKELLSRNYGSNNYRVGEDYMSADGFCFTVVSCIDRVYTLLFEDGYTVSRKIGLITRYPMSNPLLKKLYGGLCTIQGGIDDDNDFAPFHCRCCGFNGVVYRSFIESHMLENHRNELEEVNAEILNRFAEVKYGF